TCARAVVCMDGDHYRSELRPRRKVSRVRASDFSALSTVDRERVQPARLPAERAGDELLERGPLEHVVEGPLRRGVSDHRAPAIRVAAGKIVEEAPDSRDHVDVALPSRPGVENVAGSLDLEPSDRSPVQHPVVALAEAPVEEDRQAAAAERDPRGLDRPGEV